MQTKGDTLTAQAFWNLIFWVDASEDVTEGHALQP